MALKKTDPIGGVEQIMNYATNYNLDTNEASISVTSAGSLEQWAFVDGNVVEYEYYAGGVEAGNPSGSADNIENILYKRGATLVFTRSFTYDADDRVLTETGTEA